MVRIRCPIDGESYEIWDKIKVGDEVNCPGCKWDLKIVEIRGNFAEVKYAGNKNIRYMCPEDGGEYELENSITVGDIFICPGCGCRLEIKEIKGNIAEVKISLEKKY